MKDITKSNEDYLEAIFTLEKGEGVKSVDVAAALGVTKAAVSIAMNDLTAKGLVDKESYGTISLTETGKRVAESTLLKHALIKKVLVGIGVSPETAEEECCKIEHILSDETLECIKKACEKQGF